MTQYIDKDVLVAEIKRRKDVCNNVVTTSETPVYVDYYQGKAEAYKETIDLLDTLEVKEVDLEKEIQRQYNVHKNPDNSIAKDCVIMTKDGFEYFAKYFFELGMQVSNKAQKGESV